MKKIEGLTVLATISDSKKNPGYTQREHASMVVTIITNAEGYPGLAYRVIKSSDIEISRMRELFVDKIMFSFDMGVGIDSGIELIAREMLEHNDSPYLASVIYTDTVPTNETYQQLNGDKEIYVTYGESKGFILDGEPLQRLLHRLDESIWV